MTKIKGNRRGRKNRQQKQQRKEITVRMRIGATKVAMTMTKQKYQNGQKPIVKTDSGNKW